jgi:hypothetical protein
MKAQLRIIHLLITSHFVLPLSFGTCAVCRVFLDFVCCEYHGTQEEEEENGVIGSFLHAWMAPRPRQKKAPTRVGRARRHWFLSSIGLSASYPLLAENSLDFRGPRYLPRREGEKKKR